MLHLLCAKKGMGLVEVLIAIFLTTIGILAIMSLQPAGIRTMAKADYVGRASGILHKTLENYETRILNPCCAAPAMGAQTQATIRVSGPDTATSGDVTYTVNVNIAQDVMQDGATPNPNAFVVTVTVTWPANPTNGISESLSVARQELNRFPEGCTNAATTCVI